MNVNETVDDDRSPAAGALELSRFSMIQLQVLRLTWKKMTGVLLDRFASGFSCTNVGKSHKMQTVRLLEKIFDRVTSPKDVEQMYTLSVLRDTLNEDTSTVVRLFFTAHLVYYILAISLETAVSRRTRTRGISSAFSISSSRMCFTVAGLMAMLIWSWIALVSGEFCPLSVYTASYDLISRHRRCQLKHSFWYVMHTPSYSAPTCSTAQYRLSRHALRVARHSPRRHAHHGRFRADVSRRQARLANAVRASYRRSASALRATRKEGRRL